MGKKVTPPPTPNFTQTAQQQGQENIAAARVSGQMSNPNVFGPYGNQTVQWVGDQPNIFQTLTPAAQGTLNEQQNAELELSRLANWQIANKHTPGTIGNALNSPFSFGGTPQQSLASAGAVTGAPNANAFNQTSGANYGSVQGAPNLTGMGTAQGVTPTSSAIGGVQAPNLANSLDTAGVAAMPVNAGMTGQQAIMSRLAPQIAQERVSEETKLTNQGLRPGMEAWDNAMKSFNQGSNDRQIQAGLQGIGLDMSANQQGFGQALTQGNFGNQAQLDRFGAGIANINQINQATGQNFGQNLAATEAGNQALGQNQQTALAQQQAANAAQAQGFGNEQTMQAARNQATQQNFGNQVLAGQFGNQAQQQLYNQNLQGAQFGNAAQQQALQQQLEQRRAPLNEFLAMMSGSQIQNPQFQAFQGQTVAPAPLMQAGQSQAGWDQNIYNQQIAQKNALTQGLFSLGGAGLSALTGGIGGRR